MTFPYGAPLLEWRISISTYIKTFNEFSLDGILSKHIFILFRNKDSESRKASQYCTTSIVGAFSLGFRPQQVAAADCDGLTSLHLAIRPITLHNNPQMLSVIHSLGLKSILMEHFYFNVSFIRKSSLYGSSTMIEVLIKLRGTKIRILKTP